MPVVRGVRVGAMNLLGICKISKTNMQISLLNKFDTLPHPGVASVEPSWLETTHFKKKIYIHDVLWDVIERIMQFKCCFVFLTKAHFMLTHK
jgi:hypothetical protein